MFEKGNFVCQKDLEKSRIKMVYQDGLLKAEKNLINISNINLQSVIFDDKDNFYYLKNFKVGSETKSYFVKFDNQL